MANNKKNTHWHMQVFLVLYGALGLGLSAWFLTQIIHYFLLHTLLLHATAVVSAIALIAVGYLSVLIKLRRGTLEREYFKQHDKYENLRHLLLLRRALLFSVILMLICLLISYLLGYHVRIDWLGTALAFVLCFGVIYCWQLWALYCCDRFFPGFHPSPLDQ